MQGPGGARPCGPGAHVVGRGQCGLRFPEALGSLTAQPSREVTVPEHPAEAGDRGLSLALVPVRAAAALAGGSRRLLRRPCGLSVARGAAGQAAKTPPSPACDDALRLGQSRRESACLCGSWTGHQHVDSSALLLSRRARSARGEGGVEPPPAKGPDAAPHPQDTVLYGLRWLDTALPSRGASAAGACRARREGPPATELLLTHHASRLRRDVGQERPATARCRWQNVAESHAAPVKGSRVGLPQAPCVTAPGACGPRKAGLGTRGGPLRSLCGGQ